MDLDTFRPFLTSGDGEGSQIEVDLDTFAPFLTSGDGEGGSNRSGSGNFWVFF